MKAVCGKPVLWHVVNRCQLSEKAKRIIVATTVNAEDDAIAAWCGDNGISCFRGSEKNVLKRYYQAARMYSAETIVRVTADCILIDPKIIDLCLLSFKHGRYDYVSNVLGEMRTSPIGFEVEVFSFATLLMAHEGATQAYEKEHVTPYIWENKQDKFSIGPIVLSPHKHKKWFRLTMDYPEDLQLLNIIYRELYKPGAVVDIGAVLNYLDQHPEIAKINAHCKQNVLKEGK